MTRLPIAKIIAILDRRQRLIAIVLLVCILIGALLEVASVGLIVPFMELVEDPQTVFRYPALDGMYKFLGLSRPGDLIIWLGGLMFALYVSKSLFLAFLFYFQSRFTSTNQISVSHRLFRAYLTRPYTFHLEHNTAQLLRNSTTEIKSVFDGVLYPLITILIESAVFALMMGFLIYMQPLISLITMGILGGVSGLFYLLVRARLAVLGVDYQLQNGLMIQSINEGLSGIKDIKALGRENSFLQRHLLHSTRYAEASRIFGMVSQLPRLFIETLIVGGMLLIVLIFLRQQQVFQPLLPALSLFAMTSLRMMPSLNRLLTSASTLRFHLPAVEVVYNDLVEYSALTETDAKRAEGLPQAAVAPVSGAVVDIRDVSYQYPGSDGRFALSNVTISIAEGESVGIVGPSGSGKTTLVDLVIGLLEPTTGSIAVLGCDYGSDGSLYRQNIGYVPQGVFLVDATIRQNIAFGFPDAEIDDAALWNAIRLANLESVVTALPNGVDTMVGERGVRLSGGERQRLGIARALYHGPAIIIFDEATSALDHESEAVIASAIDALAGRKTLIIIAHRPSTVRNCNRLYRLEGGRILESGSYSQVFKISSVG